jgi:GTP-binding protein HflX
MRSPSITRAFLVGAELSEHPGLIPVEESLDELASLVDTIGAEVVGQVSQRLDSPHPDTYIGAGKLEEIRTWVGKLGAGLIIFDDELSPRHQRELERFFGPEARVIDRTALILDIFARHARSREGALQVSLAQYEYRLPRLTRLWTHLARQVGKSGAGQGAGGVGLRGPGETQLETDRSEISRHIRQLQIKLGQVRSQRQQQRTRRRRHGLAQVVLVGYTNAGKSTLLNALSGSMVYVADKLFATLDPTTRRTILPEGRAVLVTDTVGFIQKLPHQLVAAFRATLEEVTYADALVHVVDVSHPQAVKHVLIVENFVSSLVGDSPPPVLVVLNKTDLIDQRDSGALAALQARYRQAVCTSAVTGAGIEELLERIQAATDYGVQQITVRIPYDEYKVVGQFYDVAVGVTQMNYEAGVELCGSIHLSNMARFEPFLVGRIR